MFTSAAIPTLLRGRASTGVRSSALLIVAFGGLYGAAMGSAGLLDPDRRLQVVYSAAKVPLLLGVSFGLTVPSLWVVHTLVGARGDFPKALRAAWAAQAALALVLASLAPFTLLGYASGAGYRGSVLLNGGMFAFATAAAGVLLRRLYQPLLASDPRHRWLLALWLGTFVFVAVQMAWVLRPFVGGPGTPTAFVRPAAWSNAYTALGNLLRR